MFVINVSSADTIVYLKDMKSYLVSGRFPVECIIIDWMINPSMLLTNKTIIQLRSRRTPDTIVTWPERTRGIKSNVNLNNGIGDLSVVWTNIGDIE